MMGRLLVTAVVLFGAAWWYLTAGGSNPLSMESPHQAIEETKAVEAQLQQHADSLNQAVLKIENKEQ